MNTPDQLARASTSDGAATRRRASLIGLSLLSLAAFALGGCVEPYPAAPVYAAAPPPPVYGPGYVSGGSVSIEIGDRPYYTRGPGYYVGRSYYVWRPGHWNRRHVWVHGHYVLR